MLVNKLIHVHKWSCYLGNIQIDTPREKARKKGREWGVVRWLTYNFPNSESDIHIHSGDLSYQASCPNRNYYFHRLIYNITGVEGIQIQNLQVAYVLVGGGWGQII